VSKLRSRSLTMPANLHTAVWFSLAFCYAVVWTPLCHAVDLDEIVRRGAATLKSDWAADPNYAYVETDETRKGDKVTSKTSQVVYIDGSDYYLPLAINEQPLATEQGKGRNRKAEERISTPERGQSGRAPAAHRKIQETA
jgi:hypothetical protein